MRLRSMKVDSPQYVLPAADPAGGIGEVLELLRQERDGHIRTLASLHVGG
jgi:hypothetical protein